MKNKDLPCYPADKQFQIGWATPIDCDRDCAICEFNPAVSEKRLKTWKWVDNGLCIMCNLNEKGIITGYSLISDLRILRNPEIKKKGRKYVR